MGLVHVPRVIASIVKGSLRRQKGSGDDKLVGFGLDNPHVYSARAGLFDVDSFGHVNNAAYLTHAELARWEHGASNGLIQNFYDHGVGFYAVSTAVRYRRQIRPLFRKFQVDTTIAGIDDRYLWIYQMFRYPEDGNDRIRAQSLGQFVFVKGKGEVINPKKFLKEDCAYDKDLIDSLVRPNPEDSVEDILVSIENLDSALRNAAAKDDSQRMIKK